MKNGGKFVISLDFELYWGCRDDKSIDEYGANILGVSEIMPVMLDLFDSYQVDATFATVGLLFASTKEELIRFSPKEKPNYDDHNLSPYNGHFDLVKASEAEDKYHYASRLIQMIQKRKHHEIGTHTFSHYYCLEKGQTVADFQRDIEAAVQIAKIRNVEIKSLAFPKNQINPEYLRVCLENGITSYRGNQKAWFYKAAKTESETLLKKVCRMADVYVNLSGHNCATLEEIAQCRPFNIPASRFLRPYSPILKPLEGLRLMRVKDGMSFAARNNLVYHVWWHPQFRNISKREFVSFEEGSRSLSIPEKTISISIYHHGRAG